MGWTYLILAGVFEIGFTTFMKMSEGFTRGGPTGSFVVSAILSFWLLNLRCRPSRSARLTPCGRVLGPLALLSWAWCFSMILYRRGVCSFCSCLQLPR